MGLLHRIQESRNVDTEYETLIRLVTATQEDIERKKEYIE